MTMPSIIPTRLDASGGVHPISTSRVRHTLKGRQDAAAVAASRHCLLDLKTQAAAGAIDNQHAEWGDRSHSHGAEQVRATEINFS